ncbi:MAG: helix-turn-helix domain-containing protein [Archangium sp.]|nr:helix-turn-helix domain-containing protein [Archangium sp.]
MSDKKAEREQVRRELVAIRKLIAAAGINVERQTATFAEAAVMLKVTAATIRQMVKRGTLRACTVGGEPRISLAQIRALQTR